MEKEKFIDTNTSEPIAELLSKRDHGTSALWAADCAEHVLPYFQEKYLNDTSFNLYKRLQKDHPIF
jgi:hypothetical protein